MTNAVATDPMAQAVAALIKAGGDIDRAAYAGDEEAEKAGWERWNKADDAFWHAEPASIDGVVAFLRYMMHQSHVGNDIEFFMPAFLHVVRGLRKMRDEAA